MTSATRGSESRLGRAVCGTSTPGRDAWAAGRVTSAPAVGSATASRTPVSVEFLRRAAKAGAAQRGELRSQLLHHQRLGVNLGLQLGDVALQIARQAAQIVGIAGQIRRRKRHDHV